MSADKSQAEGVDLQLFENQQPDVPIEFVPVKAGETLKLGTITIRIMEDGSNTAQRLGIAELIIPAQTPGPPGHWHEMHDETFLVTQGTVRFHAPHGKTIDANVGDLVTVPVRAPHTFSNPGDQEARFINTFTPSFYINYFRLLSRLSEEGKPMSAAANKKAMANFATIVANLKD